MIDLHCHVLADLDDGAADLGDSVAMARQAEEDGIELICATPHIREDHDVRIDALSGRVAALNILLEREQIGVRVLPGGELAEPAAAGLDPDELSAITLGGGGRWLLVEPAPGPLGPALLCSVDALSTSGYSSVVAHPERHWGRGFVETLLELCERGALIQMTADALVRGEAADAMLELASRGFCHVLGSDSHSAEHGRPVRLSAGLARLERVPRVAPHIDWIAHQAPAAIVAGDEVRPPFPAG